MSKNISHLCLLFVAGIFLASCLNTSYTDDVTLYDDVAITQFSITNANITVHTTDSLGEDSTYIDETQVVANYPFSIDQLNGEIFNVDSMPVGIDATKLLCSYSTKNNAFVMIENIARDSIRSLTTTDSIDFSVPRYLRAYASNGESYRLYKVTVNIHQETAGQFNWTQLADNSSIAALEGMRLVVMNGRLLLFGLEAGATSLYTSDVSDGNTWTREADTFGSDTYYNIAMKGDTLFLLDGTTLKASTDGITFADVTDVDGVERLIGASTAELYGVGASDSILVSVDGGRTWQCDLLADAASDLPVRDLISCTEDYGYVDSTDYVMLLGNRDVEVYPEDTTAHVWRKVVEYSYDSETNKWIYVEADSHNDYPLPRLSGLTVINYGNSKIAFGGAGIGACDEEAFANMYVSRDGGITWPASSTYTFPDDFDTSATAVAAAVDDDNYIWIVCGGTGQVWRAKLNSIDWDE